MPPIPNRIHLIWIGSRPPLWRCIETWTNEFAAAFPAWQVRLWRDKDIDDFGLQNRRQYDAMTEYCGKADIARYEIVHREGGFYVDADTIWLGRPLDWLIEEARVTGFVGAYERFPDLLNCAFFGATAGHELLRAAIDRLPLRAREHRGSPAWVVTGTSLLGEVHHALQRVHEESLASIVSFSRIYAARWHQRQPLPLSEAVTKYRQESDAVCYQLGYSTHQLWKEGVE